MQFDDHIVSFEIPEEFHYLTTSNLFSYVLVNPGKSWIVLHPITKTREKYCQQLIKNKYCYFGKNYPFEKIEIHNIIINFYTIPQPLYYCSTVANKVVAIISMPSCAIRFEWIKLEQQNIHTLLSLFENLSVNSEKFLNIHNSNSTIVNNVITYIVQFFTNLCGWTEHQSLLWIEHERDDVEDVNSLFYHEEVSYWLVDELIPENICENDRHVKTIRKRLLHILNTQSVGIPIDWSSIREKINCVLSEFNTVPTSSYSFPIHRLYSSKPCICPFPVSAHLDLLSNSY
jgi:hypothetical protein